MISDRTKGSLKREFNQSRMAQLGLFLVVVMLLMAIFAPIFAPHDPETQRLGDGQENGTADQTDLPPVSPIPGHEFVGLQNETVRVDLPDGGIGTEQREVLVEANSSFVLGTNTLGQDILSRIVYGARVSLLVGIIGAGIAALVGVPYGLIAGYFRGRLDDALMRGADVMLAFPSLVLAIALVGVFRDTGFHTTEIPDPLVPLAEMGISFSVAGTTVPLIPRQEHVAAMPESFTFPVTVTLVVALVNWVWFARIARGEAMSLRSEEYIKAARSTGANHSEILRKHILPNAMTPVIVLATIQVAFIILLESALSFLGFSGTDLTWGADIADGRGDLRNAWWIATMPGIAIVLAVIGVNLLGDWLRDALDPSLEGESGGV